MVSITGDVRAKSTFYYLRHHDGKRELKRYMGKKIPKDIDNVKKEFLMEFYRSEWDVAVQSIIKNYRQSTKNQEESVRLKNLESFGIAYTYNTNRMGGSTLTENDTRNLLVHGLTPQKKSAADAIETQRHHDLFMKMASSNILPKITKTAVLEWHRAVFGQTKTGEAGAFRSHTVGVVTNPDVEFAPVPEIPKKTEEFFRWLSRQGRPKNPAGLAALAHYRFVSIHPFADGNGRISRLMTNYILLANDCPPLLIKNLDRARYLRALERSQLEGDEMHFLKWFMRYYLKQNKRYL